VGEEDNQKNNKIEFGGEPKLDGMELGVSELGKVIK
jgi:hypothetical protein